MNSTYVYAQGDLLNCRNSYTYTDFHGDLFMKDWRENRELSLASLPTSTRYIEGDQKRSYIDNEGIKHSESLLLCLAGQLQATNKDPDVILLSKLVQRFEVTKRVHEYYGSNWRAVDNSAYTSMHLYILYAEVMMQAYQHFDRLDFLNVTLKCIDSLIALKSKLSDIDGGHLAHLIEVELSVIDSFFLGKK